MFVYHTLRLYLGVTEFCFKKNLLFNPDLFVLYKLHISKDWRSKTALFWTECVLPNFILKGEQS